MRKVLFILSFCIFILAGICVAENVGDNKSQTVVAKKIEQPRAHIEEILKRPQYNRWRLRQDRVLTEYKSETFDYIMDYIAKYRDIIWKWLKEFFKTDEKTPDMPKLDFEEEAIIEVLKIAGWVVLTALLSYLGVLIYRLALAQKSLSGRGARILSAEQLQEALDAGDALAMSSREWLAEAERLIEVKDFRPVFRALYLALLSGMHASGKIDFRKNRTNWNYVHRFKGPENQKNDFLSLTLIFDFVWYGLKDAGEYRIGDIKKQIESLLETEAGGA